MWLCRPFVLFRIRMMFSAWVIKTQTWCWLVLHRTVSAYHWVLSRQDKCHIDAKKPAWLSCCPLTGITITCTPTTYLRVWRAWWTSWPTVRTSWWTSWYLPSPSCHPSRSRRRSSTRRPWWGRYVQPTHASSISHFLKLKSMSFMAFRFILVEFLSTTAVSQVVVIFFWTGHSSPLSGLC